VRQASRLVSIVTTSYQQARYLEETMRSVLEQDYPRLEYIVVDDGSTDGSVEIIRRYADRLAWWTAQENQGQPRALNLGFEHATGDLLGFLSSDDLLLPGAISRLAAEFERDPELVLVYGGAINVDERSQPFRTAWSADWDVALMARTARMVVPQPAALWSRRAWELAGPFNERAWSWFDAEFFLRAGTLGRVARIDEPVAAFRLHPESKQMSRHEQMAEDSIRFADEFWGGELPAALRPHARAGRAGQYRRASLALYAAGDVERARRLFLRSLLLSPRGIRRKQVGRLARTLLPGAVVRRRRARR
jgi:glycosyltransferase involved in cell wall biosynthesis